MAAEVPERPVAAPPTAEVPSPAVSAGRNEERLRAYWRANMRLIGVLLLIWFAVTYLHPPFAKQLNNIQILTGFPLGYWLASQFSITVFVILIFVYAIVMNKVIDPKYGLQDEEE